MESPITDIDKSSSFDSIDEVEQACLVVPPFPASCLNECRSEWDASFEHPFVQGLIDGSLSKEKFRFYQMQDARYLEAFADTCSILSTRYSDPVDKIWFIDGAKMALVVEQELHTQYGQELGYSASDIAGLTLSPDNRAYQNHLLVHARQSSLVEGLAALAPCPWLYTDIGLKIADQMGEIPDDHPYRNWLLTYSDPVFVNYTNEILALLERTAQDHGDGYRVKAVEAFRTSARYEWMFWSQAWDMQQWPVKSIHELK